jgi:hypothetical protein
MGDSFDIDIKHLTQGSALRVKFRCDYCGTTDSKAYYSLTENRKIVDKDSCSDRKCMAEKQKEVAFKNTIARQGSISDKFEHLVEEWNSKNEKPIEEYTIGSNDKVWWICKEGHEWEAEVYRRTNIGSGCPYCAGQRATKERNLVTLRPDLAAEWHERNKDSPFDCLPSSGKRVWWRCEHGHEWEATLNNRYGGKGCPVCRESTGEKAVRRWLEKQGLDFEAQYSFSDLLSKRGKVLKFDFAVLDKTRHVTNLIEYDGKFHFERQYDEDRFQEAKERDKLKDAYCLTKGINLIRIPYFRLDELDDILAESVT